MICTNKTNIFTKNRSAIIQMGKSDKDTKTLNNNINNYDILRRQTVSLKINSYKS